MTPGFARLLVFEQVLASRGQPVGLFKPPGGFMVALMVPEEQVAAVARAAGAPGGDYDRIKVGRMHVTLSYVADNRRYAEAVQATRRAVRGVPPLDLITTRPGFFLPKEEPGAKPGGVHWMGVAGPGLDALVARIRAELDKAGLAHDEKFPVHVPHITIEYIGQWSEADVIRRVMAGAGHPPVRFVPSLEVVDGDRATVVGWATDMVPRGWPSAVADGGPP